MAKNDTNHTTPSGPTVTDRDRQIHQQIAREAADVAAKEARERQAIAQAKTLLAKLAAVQPAAPGYGEVYVLHRLGQWGKITPDDIERAIRCVQDRVGDPPHPATLAECLEALTPIARMPRDYLNENKHAVQFAFPDGYGKQVEFTRAEIEAAAAMVGGQ